MGKINDKDKLMAAVTININGELFWLQLDPKCKNMPKTLSLGQYGITRGLDRVLEVLGKYGVKATVFVPGKIAELYPEAVEKCNSVGHEVGIMGYEDENMALFDYEAQYESIKKSIEAVKSITQHMPKGFRTPQGELTNETLLAAKENGIVYSSNLSADDRTFVLDIDEKNSIIEVPIHWVNYDLPYFAFNYNPAFPAGQDRISNYTQVLENWKDELDGACEYKTEFVLQLDPATIGSPGRIGLLEDFLEYAINVKGVKFGTAFELSQQI